MFNETPGFGEFFQSHAVTEQTDITLLQRFNARFTAVAADSEELLATAHRIRYQVYCVENAFEDPEAFPDGQEKDKFDRHSVHSLLIDKQNQEAVGTVRLVLPLADASQPSFAIQDVCKDRALEEWRFFPRQTTAEVSRFSISKHLRRRGQDLQANLRCSPLLRLGLIQSLVRMTVECGITHWCAVMEPTLLRMLAAMGIHFTPLGPIVDFHGWRQPCYCDVARMLNRARNERPAFWTVLTDGGVLYDRLLKFN